MKPSLPLIAVAVAAVLPLAAFAGEKDQTMNPSDSTSRAQFTKLDTNRDGRISQSEASVDSRIVFSTVDKNADGYLDSGEYSQRDMSKDSMPNSTDPATDPASDATKPRQ